MDAIGWRKARESGDGVDGRPRSGKVHRRRRRRASPGERMSCRDPDNLIMSDDESFDYLFKIVLIGDCGTGKTCVVQRFRSGTFVERHGNTIGVDFTMKTVLIDGKRVKVRSALRRENARGETISELNLCPPLPFALAVLGMRSGVEKK